MSKLMSTHGKESVMTLPEGQKGNHRTVSVMSAVISQYRMRTM